MLLTVAHGVPARPDARLVRMTPPPSPARRAWSTVGLGSALALVVFGAVMADTHVPVAIKADAGPRSAGAQVATFALG